MNPITDKQRAYIDSLDYEGLLREWRNAPVGSPWFQGDVGAYWKQRMGELRAKDPGGAGAACISSGCTSPCADANDCISPFTGNALTSCTSSVTFTLPDGSRAPILTCTRP